MYLGLLDGVGGKITPKFPFTFVIMSWGIRISNRGIRLTRFQQPSASVVPHSTSCVCCDRCSRVAAQLPTCWKHRSVGAAESSLALYHSWSCFLQWENEGEKKEKTNNKKRGIASKILQKKLIRNELCLENGNMLDRSFRLGVGVVLKGNILSDASLAREVQLRSVYEWSPLWIYK